MGRRRRPMDLVNMSNRRTPVLEFFGNGSIVEVEGLKPQAGEAPSTKLQALMSGSGLLALGPGAKHRARGACDKLSRVNMSY